MKQKYFLGLMGLLLLLGGLLISSGLNQSRQNQQQEEMMGELAVMATPASEPMVWEDLTPAEANDLIENVPNLVVIDVSPLWAEGHLPGSVNYYVGDGSLDEAIPDLDPSLPYLVYCHNDAASQLGAEKLVEAGFEMVYRLEGNYGAWVEAGYEVEI